MGTDKTPLQTHRCEGEVHIWKFSHSAVVRLVLNVSCWSAQGQVYLQVDQAAEPVYSLAKTKLIKMRTIRRFRAAKGSQL